MIKVFEIRSDCWPKLVDHGPFIDRSGQTVDEYWKQLGYTFTDDPRTADIWIRKAELAPSHPQFFEQEKVVSSQLARRPCVLFIGEPRELSSPTYRFADPRRSLVVAPGTEFDRMTFGRPWCDPQLENWSKRLDRIVWIGRPIGHRLAIASKIYEMGLPLDIYSRDPWPLPCYKGPAEDDVETARAYKYRIACENSNTHLYHSEKLFTSIRSGCVTLYWGDPKLDLSFVEGAFAPLNADNLLNREALAPKLIEGMNRFMFSRAWEVYSIKSFMDSAATLFSNCLTSKWWNHSQIQPLLGPTKFPS